jgi:hypothetical protein
MDSLFGLVFHDSDDSVTIKNTLNKARNECRLALATLDKHICILLDKEEVENFVNPMQPGTVFGAFWESCRDIHSGADIRFILVDMFERYVVADLHNVYDDLNTLFGYYNSCGERAVGQAMEECQQDTYSDVINQPGSIVVTRGSLLIRRWVENRLENRIKDKDIPDFIYRFLMGSWRKVMEGVYEKYSEDSLEWERGMVVVDDLITCTRLAHDRETRTQQIWMLPGLIYRLKNGMKTIPVPLKTQADFLSELKLYHTRVTELSRGRDIN